MYQNYKKIKHVLWIILFANLAVAFIKIIIGTLIRSTSMTADGYHSLTDGSSNIVGLVGIYLASKPMDDNHPYGHRKFEMMAGLFIAGMLFLICGKIIVEAINRIINPVETEVTVISMISLLVTLIINVFVCVFEYRAGKKLNSQILVSDSMHTRSDVFVSFGVLATLICIRLGLPMIIDPIVSFVVAGFIIYAAIEIFKDNSSILLDKAVVDTKQLKDIAMEFDQVKDIHNIRSRGSINDLYIDMHIMTEPELSVEKSHKLTHNIEDKIKENINANAQLIAHIEPYRESQKLVIDNDFVNLHDSYNDK
ncbi:MAG: cation transporter [Clostridiales bacterium]|nr:cation transporter [Clostridiales bacterium]